MYKVWLLNICLLWMAWLPVHAQIKSAQYQGPYTGNTAYEIHPEHNITQQWEVAFHRLQLYAKNKQDIFHTKEIKRKNTLRKGQAVSEQTLTQNKTLATAPSIGINFRGNDLTGWTPTDNSVAISNSGYIVSCINQGIAFYDTTGNNLMQYNKWSDFVGDTTLKSAMYDPRVIFDAQHQRFVVVLLHGFSSAKSKIITCISKTDNPLGGWNRYVLSGNPFQDSSWTDYPTIGVSDEDLFINGNLWGDAPNYNWHGTFIYQISLQSIYNGSAIQFGLWNQIYSPDNTAGVTLYPAMDGQGNSLSEKMYFVHLNPDSGSNVYLYTIHGKLQSPNKTLTAQMFSVPYFEASGYAFQKDSASGFIDSLSTGSAWTQNAFRTGNTIHFTHTIQANTGYSGIRYGRIFTDSNKAIITDYSEVGTDLAYPAIASLGYHDFDKTVAVAVLKSDTSFYPGVCVLSVDHDMNWTAMQTVKKGDTTVNILTNQPERWGDYTGIHRKMNATVPEVWLAGAYGAYTPPRKASYGTWIAQIKSNESPVAPLQTSTVLANQQSKIYPNPVLNDLFTLEFENTAFGFVTISIVDMQGRVIKQLFEDDLIQGKHEISFNQLMLLPGQYIVVIQRNGKIITSEKIIRR